MLVTGVDRPSGSGRVDIDPATCGGRPRIRGARGRVSDILRMMASGVSTAELLADYPYLSDADVRAALASGAAATDRAGMPGGR